MELVYRMAMLAMVILMIMAHIEASTRAKRSLIEFYRTVTCTTGREPIWHYNRYGCYCGPGGRDEPVDDIDNCCKEHDDCYYNLRQLGHCDKMTRYTGTYNWRCTSYQQASTNQSLAEYSNMLKTQFNVDISDDPFLSQLVDHMPQFTNDLKDESNQLFPSCQSSKTACGALLCLCDIRAALCFAKYPYPTTKPKCPTNSTGTSKSRFKTYKTKLTKMIKLQ